jgi:hypothetical protein
MSRQVTFTLFNPLRQPFMFGAVVATIVLIVVGTLPTWVIALVLGATIKLNWTHSVRLPLSVRAYCHHEQPCMCGLPKDPNYDYEWSM